MLNIRPSFLLIKLLLLTPGLASGYCSKPPEGDGTPAANTVKALYLLTNDEANAVVALPIDANGKLSPGTVTPTGGCGSVALNSDKQPATPDALVSQSALTVAGSVSPTRHSHASVPHALIIDPFHLQSIFAVNAGSNSLSMLAISPSDPTRLTPVGAPVLIPGDFPNTVVASVKHGVVCVGTSGTRAGISCGRFSPGRGLLGHMDALRPFDFNQTTPPVGPTNTVSQTFFSADESMLFATVKGDPATNKTGFFSAFPVESTVAGRWQRNQNHNRTQSAISRVETRSMPAGTAVLFGSQAIPGTSSVFVTDASFGAAILSVDSRGAAQTVATGKVDGQAATCWVTISPATGTAFVTDVAVNRLVEMSLGDASVLSQLDLSANGDPGLIDLRAAGNFIYALSPGNGTTEAAVTVVDVSRGPRSATMVQHFGLGGVAGRNAMGMAVLV
jgi:hypothetical protein